MFTSILVKYCASALLGFIGSYIVRFYHVTVPIKKLWNIKDPNDLIICTACSTNTDTGEYVRPATGVGQVRALGYALESLGKAYNVQIQNILLSDDQVQKQIEKDFLILGGPKNNIITRRFLDKLRNVSLVADQEGGAISWLVPGEEKTFEGEKAGKTIVKDYGLIVRAKNPFSSAKNPTTICLFCGCHTYGTIAASKYFTQIYAKEMNFISKKSDNIAFLVECDVVDGFPVAINLLNQHEF